MKKIIFAAVLLVTVIAMSSCGASKKTGCPTVAQASTNITVIA